MSDKVSSARVGPGRLWRATRVLAQALAWIALLSTPLLGGWQRADAASLSAWRAPPSWDVPVSITDQLGQAARGEEIFESVPLKGGGMGVVYFGVPIVDPVAGAMGMIRAAPSARALLAFVLPLLLALLAGRVFCGWFCPFGMLSRWIQSALLLLPHPPRRFYLGERRWLRWVVLAACLIGGAFGSQTLVTLALPHLLLSQTIFSMWLLGGGGAILGWLLGLIAAGLFFGPTTFCATVCPTGAVFALFGRFKPVRLRIEDPPACGTACRRCDLACWLDLKPATGDAGADCDNCMRCAKACPHDNLRVGIGPGAKKALPVITSLLLMVSAGDVLAQGADPYVKPSLTLDAHMDHDGTNIAVGVLDMSKVRLNADTPDTVGGSEVTVRIVRGERAPTDARGDLGEREFYTGALTVEVWRGDERVIEANWDKPNAPMSTVNRRIYLKKTRVVVQAGDEVRVLPAKGWTTTTATFLTTEPSSGADAGDVWWFFLAGLLANAGVLAIAVAIAQDGAKPAAKVSAA